MDVTAAAPGAELPDNYGLDPIATLSRVADPTPDPAHSVFWTHWRRAVDAERPKLARRADGGRGVAQPDPSDPTATHAFMSLGGIRIGARLLSPPPGTPVRAGLVSGHGYRAARPLDERDGLFAPLLESGVAVLNIRVRGYPGSRLDTGDLTAPIASGPAAGLGWIARGLAESEDDTADPETDPSPGAAPEWHAGADPNPRRALDWVYPRAIADLYNACRALRWWLQERVAPEDTLVGARPLVFMHGESFAGGLAVGAAAMLQGRPAERTALDRLVLALPTMGDWPWRLFTSGRTTGSGAEVLELLRRVPQRAGRIRARLRLCDSVVLATRVRCPVLCKLALRDEVVPAPSAAAVFNALGVDPGLKWRFVVPHGHAETGVANARKHAEFERIAADFLSPAEDPAAALRDWERGDGVERDDGGGTRAASNGSPDQGAPQRDGLFGRPPAPEDEAELVRLYAETGRTLDDLPYTDEFERLFRRLGPELGLDRAGLIHRLHNIRKAGRLPKLGRSGAKPVVIDAEATEDLRRWVAEAAGSLGQRDGLLYTPAFDRLLDRFNAAHGTSLDHHDLWRLIARLAK